MKKFIVLVIFFISSCSFGAPQTMATETPWVPTPGPLLDTSPVEYCPPKSIDGMYLNIPVDMSFTIANPVLMRWETVTTDTECNFWVETWEMSEGDAERITNKAKEACKGQPNYGMMFMEGDWFVCNSFNFQNIQ